MRKTNGHEMPIVGAAGEAVYVALKGMALHPGPCQLIVKKERVHGGGYVYTISNLALVDPHAVRAGD